MTYIAGSGWVSPPLENVPDAALCVDAACTKPGLTAEAFDNAALTGPPARMRTDANARIARTSPTPEPRNTTTRWTGTIVPPETGTFTLRHTGGSPYRIQIDDALVTDAWEVARPTSDMNVDRIAGHRRRLRVEAAQRGRSPDQRLQWSRPRAGDAPALAAAKDADLVVFVGGLSAQLEGKTMRVEAPGFAGGDRTSLDLPHPQDALLERLQAIGKPLVMMLMSGSAVGPNRADAHVRRSSRPGIPAATAVARWRNCWPGISVRRAVCR